MAAAKSKTSQCPIARSLDRIGDSWSMLILRDALQGVTRFDDFQTRLGIAPSMLTRRLNALVEAGLMERRPYSTHPPRADYLLTDCGRAFRSVIIALFAWGGDHFAPEGKSLLLVDTTTGAESEPLLIDRRSGQPVTQPRFQFAPGPVANAQLRQRYVATPAQPALPVGTGS
ncbi:MAG TPA: helix-turn-helix domain-containing protein [Dongiaceae bacterium]